MSSDAVTITGSAGFSRYVVPVSLKAGSYIFTANVNSISTSGRIRFNTASDGTGANVTSQIDFSQAGSVSREFTIAQDTAFFVMIYSSTSSTDTSSSLVISQCMIRRAEITDDTFVPYAKTNRELTVAEGEDRAALVQQVDAGAKNRLNYNLATFGDKSKITINQDGSITGSITSDTRQHIWANREFEFKLPAGDYVLLMNRLAGGGVYTSARLMTAENANLCTVATNPDIAPSMRSFTLDTDTTVGFIGKVFTDTIQLMLCTAADYAISPTFVPYRPSGQEMYDMIKALQNGA